MKKYVDKKYKENNKKFMKMYNDATRKIKNIKKKSKLEILNIIKQESRKSIQGNLDEFYEIVYSDDYDDLPFFIRNYDKYGDIVDLSVMTDRQIAIYYYLLRNPNLLISEVRSDIFGKDVSTLLSKCKLSITQDNINHIQSLNDCEKKFSELYYENQEFTGKPYLVRKIEILSRAIEKMLQFEETKNTAEETLASVCLGERREVIPKERLYLAFGVQGAGYISDELETEQDSKKSKKHVITFDSIKQAIKKYMSKDERT